MSFSQMIASPSISGFIPGTPATSSPRATPRKKRKQVKLVNPARHFDLSAHDASASTSQLDSFDSFLPNIPSPEGERRSSNSLSLDLSPPPPTSPPITVMGSGPNNVDADRSTTTPPASPPPLQSTPAPVVALLEESLASETQTPPRSVTPRWPLSLGRGPTGTTTASSATAAANASKEHISDDSMADMEEVELDDSLATVQKETPGKYGMLLSSSRPGGLLGRPLLRAELNGSEGPVAPSTPIQSRLLHSFSTPAGTHLVPQTPRSILRPGNTPATGNSVRFNQSVFFKVIERLPDFVDEPSHHSFEQLGDEGITDLGDEPLIKEEVPMIEPASSDEDEDSLEFEPTHKPHNSSFEEADINSFDDEVTQNTLTNSQTFHDLGFNQFEPGTEIIVTPEDHTGEGDWTWSPETDLVDVQPIRHFSPLAVPNEEWNEASPNNSSEWVVPADLSFGNDSLPKLAGASFSISAMVDPDATAATRIAPRRPGSAPMWADRSLESITSGATTTGTQDEEKTPVAALRTRLAASKYVATGSLSLPSTSPKTSPRMSSSRILASVVDMDELPVPSSLPSSPLTRRISPPHLAAVTEEEEETTSVRAKSPVPALDEPVFGTGGSRPGSLSLFRRPSMDEHSDAESEPASDVSDKENNPPALIRSRSPTPDPTSNTTAAVLAPHAQAVFDAQALYAKSLQDEVTSYRELLQKLKGDVVQRDTIIAKLMPVQDEMRELRAALLESRNTNKELKIEQSELREQLSDMEGVNAELRDGIQVAADEKHELNQKLEETQYDLQVARDDMNASGIQSSVSAREGPMELRAKLEEAEYQLQAAIDEKDIAVHELSHVRKQIDELQGKLQAESNMVLDLEDHNEMLSSKVTTLNASIEEKNTELEMMRAELETTSVELEAKCAELDTANVELEARSAQLEAKSEELQSKNFDLEAKEADLDARHTELEQLHTDLETAQKALEEEARREATPKVLGEADSNRSPFYGNGNGAEKNHHAHSDQLKIKDMKIKALERQVKRLNEDRELLSVAANSAQIQTELVKRRLSHYEGGTTPRANGPRFSSVTPSQPTPAPSGRRYPLGVTPRR